MSDKQQHGDASVAYEQEIAELEKYRLRRAREDVLAFAKYCIPGFEISWHHRVIAKKLTQLARGEITRLLVTLPPGHGKSTLCSIALPAFLLGHDRNNRILTASYNQSLSTKFSRQVQRLMDSEEYKRVFPETRLPGVERTRGKTAYMRTQAEFEIQDSKGFYKASSVTGTATGVRLTHALIDDPVKDRADANSDTYRQNNWDWYTSVVLPRLDKGGCVLVVLTRWHEDDLGGRIIMAGQEDKNAEQYEVVNIPAICEEEGNEDDPRKEGEALWPQRFPIDKLKRTRATIGERDFVSLYQQQPRPSEGAVLKGDWLKYYDVLPEEFEQVCIAADLGFKSDEARGDFSVFQVWGVSMGNFYLIDQVRDRMSWVRQKRVMQRLAQSHPYTAIYVEAAANGEALVSEVRQLGLTGVLPISPKGSKLTRLEAISAAVEAGNVHLPNPKMPGYQWVSQKLVPELLSFPSGKHDDQVDAFSMAIGEMRKRSFCFDISGGLAVDKQDDVPLDFLNLYLS